MFDNFLPARGHGSALSIDHQIAILFGQKETGGNSVDTNCGAVLLSHMDSEPLREVGYCCFRRTVGWHTGQGP